MDELVAENQRLKTRNGELLIKCSDLDDDNKKLKDKMEFTKKSAYAPQPGDQAAHLAHLQPGADLSDLRKRPQTAAVGSSKFLMIDLSKPDDQQPADSTALYDEVVDEMDRELNEMLEKGQKSL
jgi:hypothetical protein